MPDLSSRGSWGMNRYDSTRFVGSTLYAISLRMPLQFDSTDHFQVQRHAEAFIGQRPHDRLHVRQDVFAPYGPIW